MPEQRTGCVSPAAGPAGSNTPGPDNTDITKEEMNSIMTVQVGKPAPEFEANAFASGSFKKIKLSDYKGSWLVLCFYPGDFTFV